MLSEELIKKVRRIEINTRKVVNDVMSGQYRSHFKGHGVQFSEHRLYTHGDDIRHIDWKASARAREPLVKKFDEERELTVLLVVDVSASNKFGSTSKLKSEMAAELAGMLAYAASHTGDRVGVILFAGEVEKIIPPKRGRQHVLRIIRDILSYTPKTTGTNIAFALEAAWRIMKHAGVVFLISDFLGEKYEVQLRRIASKHDLLGIWIRDERERIVPKAGMFLVEDPETGNQAVIDTGSYAFTKWLEDFQKGYEQETHTSLKSKKVEYLPVFTKEDYGEALVGFFKARRRRRAGR